MYNIQYPGAVWHGRTVFRCCVREIDCVAPRPGRFPALVDDGSIMDMLCEQLVMAASDYDAARRDLDEIVEIFITDIKQNLHYYVYNNIRRQLTKNPSQLDSLDENRLEELRGEMEPPLKEETERIVSELRNFPGWYKTDTVYIDTSSRAWKAVKSIEPPVNRILKKFGLSPIDMKNWTWLSEDINTLATAHFPGTKKEYNERKKKYKYLEDRYREEERLSNAVERLEGL